MWTCYNLGGGESVIPGYLNVDRRRGLEAYPLKIPTGSAAVIRASHILEHFPYREVPAVLADWTSRLRSGGWLKIAVPDFRICVGLYLAGSQEPVQSYVMGGQKDDDDYHKAIFDEASLRYHMLAAGLVDVRRWVSEIEDCAALPLSLNLEGMRP